jgi:acyl transferase domain-containing protein
VLERAVRRMEKELRRRGLRVDESAALLEDIDLFDAGFLGFNPREAEGMDPQIRLFLECASTALGRAGYNALRSPGRIGIAGSAMSTYYTCNSFRTRS